MNGTASERTVERKAVRNNVVDERGVGGAVAEVTSGVAAKPVFPGEFLTLVEFVYKVHEQRRVLPLEVSHPEATSLHRKTNLVPGD